MNESHLAYLNLGSNVQPETNLPKAVKLLSKYGGIQKISSVWESEAVGTKGPNYLNACVLYKSAHSLTDLKERVITLIETRLGRRRMEDKSAPRSMDIDIILFDDQPVNDSVWELAFVVVPLADIYPEYRVVVKEETVIEIATRLRREVWLETRPLMLRP